MWVMIDIHNEGFSVDSYSEFYYYRTKKAIYYKSAIYKKV